MRVLSLASNMVTQARRSPAAVVPVLVTALLLLVTACDKVPLLAPTGSVITLFPAANSVPLNGTVEIVVTVIENGVAAGPTTPTTPNTPTPPTPPTPPPTPSTTPNTPATTTTTRAGAGTPV